MNNTICTCINCSWRTRLRAREGSIYRCSRDGRSYQMLNGVVVPTAQPATPLAEAVRKLCPWKK